jgi:hypothetical protein
MMIYLDRLVIARELHSLDTKASYLRGPFQEIVADTFLLKCPQKRILEG